MNMCENGADDSNLVDLRKTALLSGLGQSNLAEMESVDGEAHA